VKGAGYNLRLAKDLWVQPEEPGSLAVTVCREGARVARKTSITLDPGDTALVSTMERFHLDYEVSALIGPMFSRSALGLALFHGMVAHPGYGRAPELDECQAEPETAQRGQRLYLIIANAGPNTITISPGESIAYVQFFRVAPTPERPVGNLGFETLSELFLGPGKPGEGSLSYFRQAKDVAVRLARVEEDVAARLARVEETAARARTSNETVVMFGVFLVAATLLGVVTNLLVETVKSWPADLAQWQTTFIWVICGAYVLGVGWLVGMVNWRTGRRAREDPTPPEGANGRASIGQTPRTEASGSRTCLARLRRILPLRLK